MLTERADALGINWRLAVERDAPERIVDIFDIDQQVAEFGIWIVLDIVTRRVGTG